MSVWKQREKSIDFVGFEDLTAVTRKSSLFRDVTLCMLANDHRRFGGKFCLCFQGGRYAKLGARNEKQGFSACPFREQYLNRNVGETYTCLHSIAIFLFLFVD
jgi:hypothetical protein